MSESKAGWWDVTTGRMALGAAKEAHATAVRAVSAAQRALSLADAAAASAAAAYVALRAGARQ
jgi:hypothetical protein